MDTLVLKAEKRSIFGKKLASYRKDNKLPAVLYGPKDKGETIFVPFLDFKKAWREAGESSLLKLDLEGKQKNVLIHGVDIDPLKNEPRHVDFYVVDMTKEITADVPLEFEGVSLALKNLGGVLVKVMHELEVEAMPQDLPHEIVVDLSALNNIGDKITVGDLKLPKGVKVSADAEDVIVLVELPKEEIVTEEAPSLADIEVIGEKKKELEEGEAEEGSKTNESR